jgi:hypothetical protein
MVAGPVPMPVSTARRYALLMASETSGGPAPSSGVPWRFRTCRRAVVVDDPGSAATDAPYRRCPGGVIADIDCPEFAGARCRHHVERGDEPPAAVSSLEVEAMARELADDYLTPRYRRRLRALVAGADDAVAPPSDAPRAPSLRLLHAHAAVNVPSDRLASDRIKIEATATGRACEDAVPVDPASRSESR